MTIEFEDYCETTQQEIGKLTAQEIHHEEEQDLSLTSITTQTGIPLDISEASLDSLVTVGGVTGQVRHMIDAGLVDRSILNGSYEDYEAPIQQSEDEEQYIEAHTSENTITTFQQVEQELGSSGVIDSVTALLNGEEVNGNAIASLAEAYGVTQGAALREVESATEVLYEDFEEYAGTQFGISDTEHLTQWVGYAAGQSKKISQLYNQAVMGALSGDFSLAEDLVSEYKRVYKLY